VYQAVQATGLLSTSPGRWLFETAYGAYKLILEAGDVRALRPYLAPDSLAIDVGANIGFFTTRFARWSSGTGKVLAIEPEDHNFSRLERVVRRAGLEHRVSLVQGVAAESAGELKLAINPNHPGDHKIGPEGVAVKAYTLDDLWRQSERLPVSLIKIDVQGGETRVIRGATHILVTFHPALFVEVDPAALEAMGSSASELLDELSRHGYRPHDPSGEPIPDSQLLSQADAYVDVLFLARVGD